MSIGILGAGAFGTALAIALSGTNQVTLWFRNRDALAAMDNFNPKLPDADLSLAGPNLTLSGDLQATLAARTILLATPMQALGDLLAGIGDGLADKRLVACCKGIDLQRLTGPAAVIAAAKPRAHTAVLSGPSFAADIARGLPTALTLACADKAVGADLQTQLSTTSLRLYRTTDVIGAELGGALKNVVAIACGGCMGAGLGDSARAALMTRGFAEMTRLAAHMGARPETLIGLSGLGDLALTCTSDLSRNYRFGLALGRGETFDPTATVEGIATAKAMVRLADRDGIDLPISRAVHAISTGQVTIGDAMLELLNRPLKEE